MNDRGNMNPDSTTNTKLGVDRRTALKIGAGVAAGAAVWSEPTVKGLMRRPAYAQAGSCTPVSGSIPDAMFDGNNIQSGDVVGMFTLPDMTTVDLVFTISNVSGNSATYCIETSPAGVLNLDGGTGTINGSGGPQVNLASNGTALCGDTTNSLSNIRDVDWASVTYTTICPP